MSEKQEPTHPESEIERAEQEINNMDPDAYLELESVIKSIEDAPVIPEAGGIVFTEIVNDKGAILNATGRATHPIRSVQMLVECVTYLRSLQPKANWRLRKQDHSVSTAQATTQAAPAGNNEPVYVDEQQSGQPDIPASAGTGQPAQGVMTMQIVKVEITPRPDARVDLKMYAPGHKYPDLRVTNWTAQSVFENLIDPNMGWDENTLLTANEFQGAYTAQWEYSPTNRTAKGEPYKDLKRLLAA